MTIDHIFICTVTGAPAAERLIEFGLVEGPPNTHPGQGTACRRFFFENAMLELLWLADPDEALNEQTRRTRLWDRFTSANASPFGIILRDGECPFAAWNYRPAMMPGLDLQVAAETSMEEPMWCWLPRPYTRRAAEGRLAGVRLIGPELPEESVTAAMARAGAIELATGEEHLIELRFDQGRRRDFRPHLPLIVG